MNDSNGLTTILEGTIRELVRQEVKTALAEATPPDGAISSGARWVTPPQAARATGIPVKAIRNFIKEGAITPRRRNVSSNPKQVKFLVNLDDVVAVAERCHGTNGGGIDIQEQARRILSDRESRK